MLPRLYSQPDVHPLVLSFLKDLKSGCFEDDIESQYSNRLAVATDNSVYQQLPQALVDLKSTQNIVLLSKLST